MRLAFDARVRPHSSFARVLTLLQDAARAAGIPFTEWHGGPCAGDVLWSPRMDPPGVRGPHAVLTMHDVNPLLPAGRSFFQRLRREVAFRRGVKDCLKAAWRIATDSEDARARVAEAFPAARERLRVVPLYAAAHFGPDDEGEDEQLRAALGLGARYLLYVGALRPHKNWPRLVRAFGRLPAELRRAHPLVLAGRAHRAGRALRRLVRELLLDGQVRLVEEVPEKAMAALYRGAAAFAFPSLAEGFGLPPLEAMACGVPVVASDRTSLPEVLGEAARYADPEDVAALAAALEEVLGSPDAAARLRTRGLEQAARFGAARTGAAMATVLREATPGGGAEVDSR